LSSGIIYFFDKIVCNCRQPRIFPFDIHHER
jgi:hypothetical protein